MKHTTIGNIGQWLSVFIMSAGIAMMLYYRIDYGTVLFTIGCIVETLATKIKYYGDQYIKRYRSTSSIWLCKKYIKSNDKAIVDSSKVQSLLVAMGGTNELLD